MLETLRSKMDWILTIIVVVNGIRGVLSAFPVPLTWDEAVYANLANDFYYFGFFCHQPLQVLLDFARVPLLPFTIYLAYLVTTPNIIVAQMVTFLISLAGIYAVYLLGKELYNETVGKFSALALTCGLTFLIICWGILSEVPFIVFSSLFLLFVVRAQRNPKYYVLAGVSLTLSFLSRYPGALILLVGLAYVVFSKSVKRTLKSPWLYLGILCALLMAVPWLYHSKMNTGEWLGFIRVFFTSTQTWSRTPYVVPFITPTPLQFILFYLESVAYAVLPIFIPGFLFSYFYIASKIERESVAGKTLLFWILMFMVAYLLLMPNSRLVDFFRYNQTSLPAFSVLTGLGLAILLTNEFNGNILKRVQKSFLKGKRNLAVLLLMLNVTGGFIGVYVVRSDPGLTQPLGVYEYLKYTTYPWQIILTNVYPMATHYTDRLCLWIPDIPSWLDDWANSGYVGAIFVSLFRYVPITTLLHLETSPLYQRELVLYYQGLPYMIVYRPKT
nr:glycosyltransferase family 39 protein [Candidatus Freyarchaeota archaeon]